uniref:NADH-ubiquinone oxidoreductase chain 1 n=1 Tax=Ryssota otaheitana TaxID=2595071 RepID=A0A5B8FJZ0_9EUPU|nr:NADH dehydrogenase subunit 1 [Ryssota otaheitana]QDM39455.1 NADH dehydrogenase subunit 1 [Ryssota otaheitana]
MLYYLSVNLVTCLCVILSVAYFTLLERKTLGYTQTRKGPNKVGSFGLLQPLSDALKLFVKEKLVIVDSNILLFYIIPSFSFTLSLFIWYLLPSFYTMKFVLYGLMLFFCVSALNVYGTMMAGWASNSKYAFLGAMRAAAQTISYEVMMIILLLFPSIIISSLCWNKAMNGFPILMLIPLLMIWFTSTLAETNRAPFDFAEGESELVSGFNIEYYGGLFALLFLGEYMSILFMAVSTTVWFFWVGNIFVFISSILFVSIMFLLSRATFPRYRYDLLMMLCWKSFLPIALGAMVLSIISFML